MTSGVLFAEGFRALPTPTRVIDAQGKQWAGYDLAQAKQLMVLDDELYSLRLQKEIWGEVRKGYEGQVGILKELIAKEEQKYELLNVRFQEKAVTLDKTIEEKNQYKYRRTWALFGGRSFFLSGLLLVGLGVAVTR